MKKTAAAIFAIMSLIVSLIASLIATSAFAADMAVKAPPPRLDTSISPSWTGFYLGANGGYGWGGPADSDTNVSGFEPIVPGPVLAFSHSDALKFSGVLGGVQAGYNWQTPNRWLVGVETDWQASSERAGRNYRDPYTVTSGIFTVVGALTTAYTAKISSLGTIRARAGYIWDNVLLYATGGYAYGDVKVGGSLNDTGVVVGGPAFSLTANFAASHVNSGWTAGAGIEQALAQNWTWKVEYLYVDLGSLNVVAPGTIPGETINIHDRFTDNILRAGLNYQFR